MGKKSDRRAAFWIFQIDKPDLARSVNDMAQRLTDAYKLLEKKLRK